MVWRGAQAAINSSSPMGDTTHSFIVSPAFSRERLLSWQIGISIGLFQFTASYTDGTIVLSENVEFSANDGALLQKLLRHLETASKRTLLRRPRSNNSLWQRCTACSFWDTGLNPTPPWRRVEVASDGAPPG